MPPIQFQPTAKDTHEFHLHHRLPLASKPLTCLHPPPIHGSCTVVSGIGKAVLMLQLKKKIQNSREKALHYTTLHGSFKNLSFL